MAQKSLEKKFHDTYSQLLESYKQLKEEIKVRKQAEDEIVRQKKYIESIINCSVDGINAFDRKFRYTAWNLGMEYISGVSEKEAIGKNAFKLFPFLAKIGEDKYFKKTLEGRTVVSRNRPYTIPKTGRKGFFEARYSPLFNENGDIIGGLAVVRDITQRKKTEDDLEKASKRYKTIVEDQTELICRYTPEGILTFVNDAYCKYYKKSAKSLIEKPYSEHLSKFDYRKDLAHLSKITPKNPIQVIEHKAIVAGKERWQRWIDRGIFDKKGNLIEFQSVGNDITKHKETDEKLRYQASLISSVSDAIFSVDNKLRITSWNRQAEKLYGWKEKEVIGKPIREFVKTKYPNEIRDIIMEILYKKGFWRGKIMQKTRDGEWLNILSSSSLLRNEKKEIIGVVSIARDITQMKKAEDKIAHLASFPELNPNPVCEIDFSGKIIYLNPIAKKIFPNLVKSGTKHLWLTDFNNLTKELTTKRKNFITRELKIGKIYFEQLIYYLADKQLLRIYGIDITERKKKEEFIKKTSDELEERVRERTFELAEAYLKLKEEAQKLKVAQKRINVDNALLKLIGKSYTRKKYLDEVLKLIKNWSGCQCAGIRVLNQTGDIPYESYYGFSKKFWESENWLNVNSDQCACIRVVKGKLEPEDTPAMTKAGSFRTDNSFKFLSGLSRRCQKKYRGVCIRSGFASVAVIPIRYDRKTYGAIHLADRKEGKVPPKTIEFIESIAPLIGEGMHNFEMQDRLQKNYEMLDKFFSNAHVLVTFMDKDFNFIRVNRAYAGAGGYSPEYYIGKNHFDLFPNKENEDIFKQVVRSGETYSVYAKPFRYKNQPEKGTTFWDWTLHPLKDDAGNVTELLLTLVDVTDQTKASNKLLRSYKYIGIIDRKISTLIKFIKQKGIYNNTKDMVKVIINCAMQLSGAEIGALYYYDKRNEKFNIVSSSSKEKVWPFSLHIDDFNFLQELASNRARKQTIILRLEDKKFILDHSLKYFLAVPLFTHNILKGVILLGFSDRDNLTYQELKFYEIFIDQTSSILENNKVLK